MLEAISRRAVLIEGVTTQYVSPSQALDGDEDVRLFTVTDLAPVVESHASMAQFQNSWTPFKDAVDRAKEEISRRNPHLDRGSSEFSRLVSEHLLPWNQLPGSTLEDLERKAGKVLSSWTDSDFLKLSPITPRRPTAFAFTIADVFLSYYSRRLESIVNKALQEHGMASGPWIPDADFQESYGEPPWVLMNRVLSDLGQPYEFAAPHGYRLANPYEPKLTNTLTGAEVGVNDLSSGEKVLLVVAIHLYASSALGNLMKVPKALLLDEPDALLHPSMIDKLLAVLRRVFVEGYGVKVLLASHSPTTVALAPEDSLYIMSPRGTPRLRKAVSRDEALVRLTVGLPTLSVRIENRRQVFVESDADEACYEAAYRALKSRVSSPITLQFIASGRGGAGSRQAVYDLVKRLRTAGNASVYGIVDRDDGGETGTAEIYLSLERYTLENFVLDPLVIGAFLIRERHVRPTAWHIPAEVTHLALTGYAQQVVDGVVNTLVMGSADDTPVTCRYAGGAAATIPKWYLDAPGHSLETTLREAFPPLQGYKKDLLRKVADRVFLDAPDLIPLELLELFRRIAQR